MQIEPKVMYKLGVTTMADAAQRLSEDTAAKRGFKRVALGKDYRVIPMWSRWVPKEVAMMVEDSFKKIKKNIWTRTQYNGITECRYFTKQEVDAYLDNLRDKFPAEQYHTPKAGYIKLYFDMLIKKPTKADIYDDTED